jgi:hypothetical protein
MQTRTQDRRQQRRWAPWWVYVIALVVTNQARTLALQPDDLPLGVEIALGVGSMALVATLITVVYRAVRS